MDQEDIGTESNVTLFRKDVIKNEVYMIKF